MRKIVKRTYYTIIVVTDYADRLFKFRITGTGVIVAIVSFVGVLSAFGLLLFTSIDAHYTAAEYFSLKSENGLLKEQMKEFNKAFEGTSSRIENDKLLKSNLLALAGIENDKEQPFGIGGPTPEDDTSTFELSRRHQILTDELAGEMDKLRNECSLREKSLQELLVFCEGQEDLLDSTPSIWPTRGFITSGFGFRRDPFTGRIKMHEGLDIANKTGTVVHAGADGLVIFAGIETGYGNLLTIDHGYGLMTRYGHLETIIVKEGDKVKKGDKIGTIGCTGACTGPHLHYEVRVNGIPMDPRSFVPNNL